MSVLRRMEHPGGGCSAAGAGGGKQPPETGGSFGQDTGTGRGGHHGGCALSHRRRRTGSCAGRRSGAWLYRSPGRRAGHRKKHAAAANLSVFRGISQRAVCLRRGICQADQASCAASGRDNQEPVPADGHGCPEHLRHHLRQPSGYCHHRLHPDHAYGRDLFQPRQSDPGAGVYQSVYAHRKTAGYPHLDRGTREQGRCDCRAKGHGAHCGYRAVF